MKSKLDTEVKAISRADFDSMFSDFLHLDFITEEQFGALVSAKEREMLGQLGVEDDVNEDADDYRPSMIMHIRDTEKVDLNLSDGENENGFDP